MAKIIRKLSTRDAMDRPDKMRPHGRGYLGMSRAGAECIKSEWYGLHWASPQRISKRIQRIFDIGHMFEQIAIKNLKSVGCEVYRLDKKGNRIELTGAPGEKQEEIKGITGHEGGHPDGRVIGILEAPKTEHTLELKTMMEKYFIPLVKSGVEKAFPMYYDQVQRYMLGMRTKRTYFLGINKNTCEYYAERIELDEGYAQDLARKQVIIVTSTEPPPRGYPEGFYKCVNCDDRDVCDGDKEPQKNCRTCDFSDMQNKGVWVCENKKSKLYGKLTLDEQKVGCKKYKKGWGL